MSEVQAQESVLFDTQGGALIITLNRPKALNALSLEMIRAMDPVLRRAATDPAIRCVILQGAGDRAFCAGGDVRAVAQAVSAGAMALADAFFREEYTLNHLLHTYPKPIIALIHGICMGGGVGLSAHGPLRVVTDSLMFAMPETGIGLFPDVGGTWVLNQMPGQIGLYLGLTGARLGAADACAIGFATHHIKDADLPALRDALVAEAPATDADAEAIIARFDQPRGDSPLLAQQADIDRLFAGDSIEAILAALTADGSAWAKAQAETLAHKSPTSLKITLEQLHGGKGLDIAAVFVREYRLSQHCMAGPDFREGIRALLIDKDQAPKWSPATLNDVTPDLVKNFFAALPGRELDLTKNG
ncbi:enoyl-CoA hydratase/isomerase family protein [Elstera cyanobacteriorum]|uniref:enoyl-CoA hydratase/isomerase family protein n=1 Tax=Elstera cyanobacteriorum TaxID=2022747 RepID=UPI0023537826|nr:enoyl-CoA hydratase/isomerase family protein [Elstera cyanobacteriorum]MCK6443733.1 enoyl-CoA hydratase/isomerase family protein [Elstera cyanobacteriorum]